MHLIEEIRSLPPELGLELALDALTAITASDDIYLGEVMREFGLKRTEARLLIHLYMVHPRLSPTDCIAAALWGFDDVFGTDGIRHSVKRLRRVLGDNVINCSYGVGYRLSDDMAERMPVRPEVELPSFPALPKGKWRGYEPWTDDEDARLADLLALKVSRDALAKVFGRTKDAIDHRAKVIRAK